MKPLTDQCLQMVLQEMRFLKRKELYAKYPAIRNQEERTGYRLNEMMISQRLTKYEIYVDGLEIVINNYPEDKTKKCGVRMTNKRRGPRCIDKSIDIDPDEAAEKWVTYILNRPNTRIQNLYLFSESPICILKCDEPMSVINIFMYVESELPEGSGRSSWVETTAPVKYLETKRVSNDDTMKAALMVSIREDVHIDGKILSEWQANRISSTSPFPLEEVVTYCTGIAESGRPIGFHCQSFFKDAYIENSTIDWLAEKLNARKTSWDERKCFTIPLDDASELNVHGNFLIRSTDLIIEVNAKGTAIDRDEFLNETFKCSSIICCLNELLLLLL
uniref:SWIB domain-containing protein n=1 Tax=Caenorhabditis tropicalis TaxID=1561998 RepID=A0A1I7V125_9PELO